MKSFPVGDRRPTQLPEGMAIDLGGIGKGFAAETLRKCLHEQGIQSAVLSLGGNVTLLGSKPDGCGLDRRACRTRRRTAASAMSARRTSAL